jgi:hypothetical protein
VRGGTQFDPIWNAYSWVDNDVANKDVYGALYNWYAVGTNKLCPAGWSIPSFPARSPSGTMAAIPPGMAVKS